MRARIQRAEDERRKKPNPTAVGLCKHFIAACVGCDLFDPCIPRKLFRLLNTEPLIKVRALARVFTVFAE